MTSIVYHSGCPDGIVAKEMIRTASNFIDYHNTIFVPFQYGMKVLDRDLKFGSLWVDCCPEDEGDFYNGLIQGCIYIDHHETVKAKFQKWFPQFPEQLIFGETNFGHSGASLTYNYIIKEFRKMKLDSHHIKNFDEIYCEIQRLAAIADTWQSVHPDFNKARAMSSLIATVGNELNIPECHQGLIQMAIAYDKNKRQLDERKAANVKVNDLSGLNVAILNDSHVSDISEILRNREENPADLIVGFFYVPEGDNFKVVYSLRSNDNFDCSKFAKSNGGGGHVKAAGFSYLIKDHFFDPINYFYLNLASYRNENS